MTGTDMPRCVALAILASRSEGDPMATPDKPLRVEIEVEIAATPEQVWDAIASGEGISSWFMPTDLEPGEGGAIVTHMGEDSSPGSITGWDPPRRLTFEEPQWAELAGHPGALVTPLTTEFLVEARSGGTCVVRVTASAFGTGAEWEHEFIDDMATYYRPYFDLLRIYVEQFPGQHAVRREVQVDLSDAVPVDDVVPAAARSLGVSGPGEAVDRAGALGLSGTVLRLGRPYLMVEVDAPVQGYVSVMARCVDDSRVLAGLDAWLFGPDAEAFAAGAEPGWRSWLAGLADAPTGSRARDESGVPSSSSR
jgi:uncharacterized protein YndB with AHSA1/START domain